MASWADDGVPESDTQGKPAQIAFVDGWNLKPDLIVEKSDAQEHKSGMPTNRQLGSLNTWLSRLNPLSILGDHAGPDGKRRWKRYACDVESLGGFATPEKPKPMFLKQRDWEVSRLCCFGARSEASAAPSIPRVGNQDNKAMTITTAAVILATALKPG